MFRRFAFPILFLAVATSALSAQQPPKMPAVPVKAGPPKAVAVKAGGFADITPDAPPGADVLWVVTPDPTQTADGLTGGRLIFAGTPGGKYTAIAVVIDYEKKTKTRTDYAITFPGAAPQPVPPIPPPKPIVPVPNDGRLGLIKASRDGLAQVKATAIEAKALAGANRSLASAVAAGGVTDAKTGQFTAAAALTAWRASNNGSVSTPATWTPWGVVVSNRLAVLSKDGNLPTKMEWAEAFNEIATGLEQ